MADDAPLEAETEVINPQGLHLRPMTQIIQALSALDAEVMLHCDQGSANGAMITELMMLFAPQGTRFKITATGRQAREALDAVLALFGRGFGE